MTKAPRYTRRPKAVGGIRIQKRDVEIVKLVHDYRFMDSRQIQMLIDGSNQVILRRLQKLFHHGYLDRPVSQIIFSNPLMGHENMVYGLGDRGADLLAERLGIDRGKIIWKEKNKEVRERYIQHTLMISNFRACLTLALRATPEVKLLFWIRENPQELKEYVSFTENGKQRRMVIVPDGFFCIQDAGGRMYFFLEADRSTMTNTRFLNKLKAYWKWRWQKASRGRHGIKERYGIRDFRVLTLTRGRQRRDNLTKVAERTDDQHNGSYMFWFAAEEHFSLDTPQAVLHNIWQTAIAGDQKMRSLLE